MFSFNQISMATIGFSIYRYIIVSVMLKSLLAEPNLYPDFSNLAFWNQTFQNGAGITIFVSWIKIFKYISFNKTMSQLSGTLTQVRLQRKKESMKGEKEEGERERERGEREK
jgi:hypothetical protein